MFTSNIQSFLCWCLPQALGADLPRSWLLWLQSSPDSSGKHHKKMTESSGKHLSDALWWLVKQSHYSIHSFLIVINWYRSTHLLSFNLIYCLNEILLSIHYMQYSLWDTYCMQSCGHMGWCPAISDPELTINLWLRFFDFWFLFRYLWQQLFLHAGR